MCCSVYLSFFIVAFGFCENIIFGNSFYLCLSFFFFCCLSKNVVVSNPPNICLIFLHISEFWLISSQPHLKADTSPLNVLGCGNMCSVA